MSTDLEENEPELFGTETMAELCARQGQLHDAILIYRRLIAHRADDERCEKWTVRCRALERAQNKSAGGAVEPGADREATRRVPVPAIKTRQPPSKPAANDETTPLISRSEPREAHVEKVGNDGDITAVVPVSPATAAASMATPDPDETVAVFIEAPPEPYRLPLLVRQAVRSGQVVYAERNDLIVIASVNPGAQLMADGNIHVYGALRGRAIAGAQGSADARIFCQKLDAELIAINGVYLTNDDFPPECRGKPAQIFLHEGECVVTPL